MPIDDLARSTYRGRIGTSLMVRVLCVVQRRIRETDGRDRDQFEEAFRPSKHDAIRDGDTSVGLGGSNPMRCWEIKCSARSRTVRAIDSKLSLRRRGTDRRGGVGER